MQNSIQMRNPLNSKMVFDLKGSQLNRYVSLTPEEKALANMSFNQKKVMKDLNFLEIDKSYDFNFFRLDKQVAGLVADQLEKDASFLSRFKIMDYSLMITVENLNPKEKLSNPEVLRSQQFIHKFDKQRFLKSLLDSESSSAC